MPVIEQVAEKPCMSEKIVLDGHLTKMASEARLSRLPSFKKWGSRCSRKAHCSSSVTDSPDLKKSLESQPESVTASIAVQTDAPAFTSDTGYPTEAESKALGNSSSKLDTAESARAAETKPAASEVHEVAEQSGSLRTLIAVLATVQADARAEVEALRAKNAALQQQMSEKEKEHQKQVSGLLEDSKKHREECRRSEKERERFHYVLACNGQEGSVPRSVLASAPESLLYKMYSGDWDYARDDQGRALITCHPQRWAAVLEHLATGAVPAERDPLLLAQARHWNLQRLVEGLEALDPGVTVTNDADLRGFKVRCTFVSVMEKLSGGKEDPRFVFRGPQERWWGVKITKKGVALGSLIPMNFFSPKVEDLKGIRLKFMNVRLLLRSEDLVWKSAPIDFPHGLESFVGFSWGIRGYGLEQLLSEPLARAPDSLVIEVEVHYEDQT
ncbi:hypothetical protein KFL_002820050 [Klebsormidium nitens]|uniref:Potassium channel tetramerisation-type BTB domain-containing protein n=1 Tax=Klebsormidium nitens TaxID=105231 RepID=A0A1Y1IA57_KLENI|nr:hypothetical protein KFL_002820050 [Klebsormidium nitens]|eukprot:GAQ86309.1 hypothetical protein KFL_002820050 [Klebsormidium nitens]